MPIRIKKPVKVKRKPKQTKTQLVSQPVAKGSVVKRNPPTITPLRDGLRIRHREHLFTYTQTTNFAWRVRNFPINPGLPGTFPWLSGLARMFEQYVVHKLTFHYVPIAPTSYPGAVVMCVDYDPRDAEYNLGLTRIQMMQNASAVSGPVWSHCSLSTKSSGLMGGTSRKFVRVYDVDPLMSTSVRSSDCGDFIIGVSTDDLNTAIATRTYGDIWIEYDVTLLNPQPNMNPPSGFQTLDMTTLGPGATVTMANVFASPVDPVLKDQVKVDGGLIANQSWSSTGADNRKTVWNLIDLIPGAYYWVTAALAETAAGVSDTLTFLTGDALWSGFTVDSNVMNRMTTTSGGTNVAIRALLRAVADRGSVVVSALTASGGASAISGSLFSIVPTPSLRDIFAEPTAI